MCVRSGAVQVFALPVGPAGDVLEAMAEPPAGKVLYAQNAVSPTGMYEVFKGNASRGAVSAGPRRRHRPAWVEALVTLIRARARPAGVWLKPNCVELGFVKDAGATDPGVSKRQLIRLGPDQVPGISVMAASRNEVETGSGGPRT